MNDYKQRPSIIATLPSQLHSLISWSTSEKDSLGGERATTSKNGPVRRVSEKKGVLHIRRLEYIVTWSISFIYAVTQ
jgi:hypothetical protein